MAYSSAELEKPRQNQADIQYLNACVCTWSMHLGRDVTESRTCHIQAYGERVTPTSSTGAVLPELQNTRGPSPPKKDNEMWKRVQDIYLS